VLPMPRGITSKAALRVAVCAALCVAVGTTGFRAETSAVPGATRALWVTRTTLASSESISQMVRAAEAGGFNTLLVQVRARGDAYFDSSMEPRGAELAARPDFDPLATTITLARAAGLKVHAWVSVNLVSSAYELPPSRQHIVYRSPEWLMVPRELAAEMRSLPVRSPAYLGRLARWTRAHSTEVEGLYVSPLSPAAAIHTAAVIGDMVGKYELDGVHLDYVRFPSEAFDYGPAALEQFKLEVQSTVSAPERSAAVAREALDPLAYPNLFPNRWDAFRRSRLTSLVMRVRTAVKAARPGIVVSAAVVPDAQQAFDQRFQDWRTWLDESLVDVLCPMAYTPDAAVFQQQVAAARAYAGDRPVWAGIGAYRLSATQTLEHIAAAQRLGTAGIILFSYDALIAPPNNIGSLSALGRAAFRAGSH
jgi:uncharacterized lipoprotein YddW (UPF0748 family)